MTNANFDSGYQPSHTLDAKAPPFLPGFHGHGPDSVHQSTPVVQETRDVANSQVLTGCPITSTNNSEQENIPDNNDAQDEEDNDTQDEEDNDASGRHGNEVKESDDNDPELMKELSKLLISMNAKMDESMATAMRMNASLEKYSNEPP